MQTYKDLIVWQKSYQLCKEIFVTSRKFPLDERFVLTAQMKRSALSVPSNIAEGFSRKNEKEKTYFLRVAFGSARELETQLLLSWDLQYLKENSYKSLNSTLVEVLKMLNVLTQNK